ncbi:MAG: GAF domain-containing protein [Fimbriimonadaceae bacterium]
MLAPSDYATLTAALQNDSSESALQALLESCLAMTNSRNAILARLDDDLGCLLLVQGAGADWEQYQQTGQKIVSVEVGEGIISFVAATGASFLSGNVQSDPHYKNLFESTRSEIAVPIRDRHDRIRAVLNVESERPEAYNEQDHEICGQIAQLMAVAIDQGDLENREQALVEISGALYSSTSEDELLERVIHVAGEVLHFQAFSIFLWDEKRESYVLRGSVGRLKSMVGQIAYQSEDGCTGWVCAHGKSIRSDNPQDDPRWRGLYVEFPSEQIASFLAVPIIQRGVSIGALRAVRRVTDNPFLDNRFTDGDQRMLETIASQVAAGLENIRSFQGRVATERMAAWGELSAKSSHMIGNRVFALRGDVNELGHMLDDGHPERSHLQRIQQSLAVNLTRIEEILQEFRDFVTATKLGLEATNVNSLVEETLREVFPKRSEIGLKVELDRNLPPIQADQRKIRRAISELVENALIHTREGEVQVKTGIAERQAKVEHGLPADHEFVQIDVIDTGPGVDEKLATQIFEPFFSTRVKGMGLGLSIVKGIVDAHMGAISVRKEEPHGAHFMILLPISGRLKP